MRNLMKRARRLPAARAAISLAFFLNGVGFASWVVRIPDVQRRLGLSESELGLALLGVAVGGLLAIPLSGFLIAKAGSRPVARSAALLFAATLVVPALAPTRATLTLGLVALGAANSVMAVALNTQAASVERRFRRPIMAGMHALYSLGGLVGALIGGAVAGSAIPVAWHLAAAGTGMIILVLLATPALLRPGSDGASGGPAFARPSRSLALLGAVAFCVLFGEGAAADWSAVYLRDVAAAGPALAAAGYAAFSLTMAAGRFVGDALLLQLGSKTLVRTGGALATTGIALAVALPEPWAVVTGMAAVGAGLSAVFPTVLAAAGRTQGSSPATAIAAVSSIGYTGFLIGPAAIGFAAEAVSLRVAFGIVGLTSAVIVLLAYGLPATGARRQSRATRANVRLVSAGAEG